MNPEDKIEDLVEQLMEIDIQEQALQQRRLEVQGKADKIVKSMLGLTQEYAQIEFKLKDVNGEKRAIQFFYLNPPSIGLSREYPHASQLPVNPDPEN